MCPNLFIFFMVAQSDNALKEEFAGLSVVLKFETRRLRGFPSVFSRIEKRTDKPINFGISVLYFDNVILVFTLYLLDYKGYMVKCKNKPFFYACFYISIVLCLNR